MNKKQKSKKRKLPCDPVVLYVVMAPGGEVMYVVTAFDSPTLIACVEHILLSENTF